MDTTQAITLLTKFIFDKCPEAEIENAINFPEGYDAELIVKLPKSWAVSKVTEFEDCARQQAYDLLVSNNIDIRVVAYNLTRNQQELVKWLYKDYPEISVETLPASLIEYDRNTAHELFEEHYHRINEGLINASAITRKDKTYIMKKYGDCHKSVA